MKVLAAEAGGSGNRGGRGGPVRARRGRGRPAAGGAPGRGRGRGAVAGGPGVELGPGTPVTAALAAAVEPPARGKGRGAASAGPGESQEQSPGVPGSAGMVTAAPRGPPSRSRGRGAGAAGLPRDSPGQDHGTAEAGSQAPGHPGEAPGPAGARKDSVEAGTAHSWTGAPRGRPSRGRGRGAAGVMMLCPPGRGRGSRGRPSSRARGLGRGRGRGAAPPAEVETAGGQQEPLGRGEGTVPVDHELHCAVLLGREKGYPADCGIHRRFISEAGDPAAGSRGLGGRLNAGYNEFENQSAWLVDAITPHRVGLIPPLLSRLFQRSCRATRSCTSFSNGDGAEIGA
ncbi:hypothetical protein NDU88_005944 [Pleurodeles waltl]|uniref:Collagen alpha-1(I) chain-like n=1 Tax=Pleurodeles waltl TaxID=8319 RepID=A0AAV7UK28_PLEWA|nr:hypothetical protein NDU88_005944 [Pleurodeles waltl]